MDAHTDDEFDIETGNNEDEQEYILDDNLSAFSVGRTDQYRPLETRYTRTQVDHITAW